MRRQALLIKLIFLFMIIASEAVIAREGKLLLPLAWACLFYAVTRNYDLRLSRILTVSIIIFDAIVYLLMRNVAMEISRCDVKSGNVLDIEHLFRVDGLRAFDRIFNVPIVMQPEREYEVIIRFLNPRFIMPHLSVGKQFALEIGSDVGAGTVLEIHDYDDLMTTWAPVDCPWTGNGVTRPDYYLTTPLFGKGKMPIACFVRRKAEVRGGIVNEVAIDPTLDRETAKRLGLEDGQLFVKKPKGDTIGGKAVVLSSFPDGRWFSRSKKLAACQIYQTWEDCPKMNVV